jgi:hypothetical protein
MLELKNAYEILGLKENANRDELEKRFEYLIKKSKSAKMLEDSDQQIDILNLDEISEAYNRIISNDLAILQREEEKRNPRKPNPIFKLIGVDEKKARNYIHYHKFHYILGFIGILVLAYFIKTVIFHVNPDVSMAFIGQIYYDETSALEEKIKANDPDIKEVGIDGVMLTGDSKNMQESAMLQKAMVLFAAGDIDIFVLDKENFNKYSQQGAFSNLDDLVSKLELDESRYKDYILKTAEDKEEHVYGIDINNSKILKETKIVGKNMMVALRVNAKHYDKAVKILELLVN